MRKQRNGAGRSRRSQDLKVTSAPTINAGLEQMRTPIFDGRGQWKENLPDEAAKEFEQGELGDLMRRFGYLD